jgi:hypothetical protein
VAQSIGPEFKPQCHKKKKGRSRAVEKMFLQILRAVGTIKTNDHAWYTNQATFYNLLTRGKNKFKR